MFKTGSGWTTPVLRFVGAVSVAMCAVLLAGGCARPPAGAKPPSPASVPGGKPAPAASRSTTTRNPFEAAALEFYSGRFTATNAVLKLAPEDKNLKGTLDYLGHDYTVKASLAPGKIEGRFGDGKNSWTFSAVGDEKGLWFTSDNLTNRFERQPTPRWEGIYTSDRVWLRLDKQPEGYAGRLRFRDQEYTVAGQMAIEGVEGTFQDAKQSFPFSLTAVGDRWEFVSGPFKDRLQLKPRAARLTVELTPYVAFRLLREGKALSPSSASNTFEFSGAESLALELQAKGYRSAKTNLLLPDYGEERWSVSLERLPFPGLDTRRWTNSLDMVFVSVPGTRVLFGVWDTRVQDYRAFATATRRDWKKPDFDQTDLHPVVHVSWEDAKAFCAWLTRKDIDKGLLGEGQRYRLPTDEEWSRAVGLEHEDGDCPKAKDAKIKDVYPWGTDWPPPKGAGNYSPTLNVDDFPQTAPVASFAPTAAGVYDLGGNVWQWCEDWYSPEQKYRVLRGGSWVNGVPERLLSSCRGDGNAPENRYGNTGFRCVLAVEE